VDGIVTRLADKLRRKLSESPTPRLSTGGLDASFSSEISLEEDEQLEQTASSARVLRDAHHPDFEKILGQIADTITRKHFRNLVEILIDVIKSEDDVEVSRKVLTAFKRIGARDPEFFRSLVKCRFFAAMPLKSAEMVCALWNIVMEVCICDPNLLDHTTKHVISGFMNYLPEMAVELFSIYAFKFKEIRDPYPVVDLFLAYAQLFVNMSVGAKYVQILYFLASSFVSFRNDRLAVVRPILTAYCSSREEITAKAATRAVTLLLDNGFAIPFAAICRNLGRPSLFDANLDLLLRAEQFPVSRTLCRLLVDKAAENPRTFEVLLRFASQNLATAQLIIGNDKWLGSGDPLAFQLFLVLFAYPELRSDLVKMQQFPLFLTKAVNLGQPEILVAIPTVLKRADIDQRILDALTANGFIRSFIEAAKKCDVKQVYSAMNGMIERLAVIGNSSDFRLILPVLGKQLRGKDELTVTAICVLVALSRIRELAKYLKDLVVYFQRLSGTVAYKEKALVFLENVGKFSAQ
jgi:hypothetical protein